MLLITLPFYLDDDISPLLMPAAAAPLPGLTEST
jgi:hypothetical protein